MDVATLRMVVPPGRRDEIVGALRWLAGPVRAHRGCAGCRILRDLDELEVAGPGTPSGGRGCEGLRLGGL